MIALSISDAETELYEDTDAVIDRILACYHAVHRRELAELQTLADAVDRAHEHHPDLPAELPGLLAEMAMELDAHMAKEERVLFPLMRQGGHPMIAHPIAVMRHEHAEHGDHLRALAALTNDFEPPVDACGSWRALYAGLRKFAKDLAAHIELENGTLFPRFAL